MPIPTNYTSGYSIDGWWQFLNSSSLGTDSSGQGNNLSVGSGITQVAGPNKYNPYAAAFTASSSQDMSLANSSLSSGFPGKSGAAVVSVSAGCWVNPTFSAGGYPLSMTSYYFGIYTDKSSYAYMYDTSFSNYPTTPEEYLSTGWTFLTLTWNLSNYVLTYYVNGSSVASVTSTNAMEYFSGWNFVLGGSGAGYFDGYVAGAFVFGSLLAASDVANIYTYGISGSPPTNYMKETYWWQSQGLGGGQVGWYRRLQSGLYVPDRRIVKPRFANRRIRCF
jgi:hypothetical protein